MSPIGLFVINDEGHTFGRPATRPGGEHAHLVIAHPYRLLGRHAGIELAISHELSIEVHTAKNDDGVGREVLALHLDPHVVSLLDDPRSEVRDRQQESRPLPQQASSAAERTRPINFSPSSPLANSTRTP